jgi:hypothetical protein
MSSEALAKEDKLDLTFGVGLGRGGGSRKGEMYRLVMAAIGQLATVVSLFSRLESCCSADLKNKKVVKHDR